MPPPLEQRGWSTRIRSYHAIAKAYELCQKRIDEIDVQLAGAFQEIAKLDDRIESHERGLALCMAFHSRLGENCMLGTLPEDILIKITSEASGAL